MLRHSSPCAFGRSLVGAISATGFGAAMPVVTAGGAAGASAGSGKDSQAGQDQVVG